jgi:hypothetical protein
MLFSDYPYWRYTYANNRPDLYSGHPIPGIAELAQSYRRNPAPLIIEELTESDIPGPSNGSGPPVIEYLSSILSKNNFTESDVHLIQPDPTFERRYRNYLNSLSLDHIPYRIPNIHTYPYFFLEVQTSKPRTVDFVGSRSKHMMSLNGAIKPGRLEFIELCIQNNLFNNYISLVGTYGGKSIRLLDVTPEQLSRDDKAVPLDLMADSYLNVINETHEDDSVFLTEKTWKPILNLQLFLYYTVEDPQGYYNLLRDAGFELYDTVLDYSANPKAEILRFCNQSLADCQEQIESVREQMLYNQQHAVNTNWRSKYPVINSKL